MSDARVQQYAELLVGTCLGVREGWQVLVFGTPPAEPLLRQVHRSLAARDAYAIERLSLDGTILAPPDWLRDALPGRLAQPAPLVLRELLECDAILVVQAPRYAHRPWISGR